MNKVTERDNKARKKILSFHSWQKKIYFIPFVSNRFKIVFPSWELSITEKGVIEGCNDSNVIIVAIPTNFRDSSPLSTMFNIQNTPFEISIQLRETSALYSIFIPDICICMESIVSTIIENLIRWKLNYLSRRFVSNSIRILCIVHRSVVSRSEREVEERETPSTRSRIFFYSRAIFVRAISSR